MLFPAGFLAICLKRKEIKVFAAVQKKQGHGHDSGFYSVTPATPELLQLLSPIPTVQSL
jgi:hypothetical protein